MLADLRHAVRQLARHPGFTFIALLTLALGIGACTAIFSIVDGVLLRPLGFRAPEQLVWVRESLPAYGREPLPVNAPHFLAWRERARTLAGLSLLDSGTAVLTGGDQPEVLRISAVSANLFDVLGTPPALGRGFADGEDTAGRNRVVVLGHAFWQRAFAADPAAVGRTVQLDGAPHTIIGVLPASFRLTQRKSDLAGLSGTTDPDLFRPKVISADELADKFGRHNYGAIARLAPGATLAQAEAELNAIDAQFVAEAGQPGLTLRALLTPLREAIVGPARRGLFVLFGAVASVLLIACVNLMNFLLAQAESRQQEAAVRQALGASRWRLLRQSLASTMLVAGAGGLLGIGLAYAGLGLLLRQAPADLPRLAEVRLDYGVLAFSLGATVLTGLVFGLVPAWHLARTDPQEALRAGGRGIAGGRRRWPDILIAAEVGLSVVLLASAALFAGSFMKLLRAEQGFQPIQSFTGEIAIPLSTYRDDAQREAFYTRLLPRLAVMPGVEAAAITSQLPLRGETWVERATYAGDSRPEAERPSFNVRFISADYFAALGIPLRAGRTFNAADRPRHVTLISETFARTLWPGQDPVGRRLLRGDDEYEVIGVVGDTRTAAGASPVPVAYRPYWEWPPRRTNLVVRAAGDPRAAAGALRAALQEIDRNVPLPVLHPMSEVFADSVAPQRFQLLLTGAFAGTALLLTSLGIYGVVAYAVTRRHREIGVRLALGAQTSDVRRLVLGQGMRPVLIGLGTGIALALVCTRLLAALLYDTRPGDPLALTFTLVVLATIALLACWIPARRATRVDPLVALRSD